MLHNYYVDVDCNNATSLSGHIIQEHVVILLVKTALSPIDSGIYYLKAYIHLCMYIHVYTVHNSVYLCNKGSYYTVLVSYRIAVLIS